MRPVLPLQIEGVSARSHETPEIDVISIIVGKITKRYTIQLASSLKNTQVCLFALPFQTLLFCSQEVPHEICTCTSNSLHQLQQPSQDQVEHIACTHLEVLSRRP